MVGWCPQPHTSHLKSLCLQGRALSKKGVLFCRPSGSSGPGPAAMAHWWGSSVSPPVPPLVLHSDQLLGDYLKFIFPNWLPAFILMQSLAYFILSACWVFEGRGRQVCKSQLLPLSAALPGAVLRAAVCGLFPPVSLQSRSVATTVPCPVCGESCGNKIWPFSRWEEPLWHMSFFLMNTNVNFV